MMGLTHICFRVESAPAVEGIWSRQDGLAGWNVEQSQVSLSGELSISLNCDDLEYQDDHRSSI